MKKIAILLTLISLSISSFAQVSELVQPIETIIKGKKATIGVTLVGADGDTLTLNNHRSYPTQSVYKFYLALTVLSKVDEGKLSLDQKIRVKKKQLKPNTYSPLRDKYPNGNFEISLSDLLHYTVAKSDNNGCDILFKLVGGTKVVDTYIKKLGVEGISVQATEEEMHKGWAPQYTNTSTPLASVQLLERFYKGKILSEKSKAFLWETMTGRTTGMDKIKGQLPDSVIVAHKSGMSDRNAKGLKAADNDIGIVMLPDGRHFTLAVFIADSMEDDKTNAATISSIAKLVWDFYTKKPATVNTATNTK